MMFQKKRGYYGVYIWSVILTVWFCLHVALAVKILRLSVPQSVQNGTDHVILDCEYNYTANDLRLVVKWFFNNNLEPIYQWIPKLNSRHISEMLINRLDRSYKVNSPDPYFHYRALYLLHPTLEISGKYTCQVLSLAGHDQQHQKMIVYFSSLETDISCEAMGLFPQPDISVSAILPKHFKDPFLQAPKKFVNITKELYSIWISGTFNQKDFPKTDKIVLQCEVHIPETDYKVSKELSFYTGLATVNKASLRDFFRLCYILCVVVLCYCKS
ncbi:uncharacterized protein LOC111089786 isoform X2 [Limulus polyphemus]|uniref:Uncharacterized protein LOC111089786 isoform X2 n=1 Tax=Limulus polyphemus TaxID=6850 RepID=A0ABM1TRS3_LIMPO|nr:uncharacterized protein LOC111089786 isoform X2 [Limulus polyphemus]